MEKALVIRRSRLPYAMLGIILLVPNIMFWMNAYNNGRKMLGAQGFALVFNIFLFLLGIGGFICCWYRVFVKKIIMVISNQGIHYKKYLIAWEDMKSFRTISMHNLESTLQDDLIISLWSSNYDEKINLREISVSRDTIRNAISTFSTNSQIIDEGHVEKK